MMELLLRWMPVAAAVAALLAVVLIIVLAHRAALDVAIRGEREACASSVEAIRVLNQQPESWQRGSEWMKQRAAEVIRARGSHSLVVHKTSAVGKSEQASHAHAALRRN